MLGYADDEIGDTTLSGSGAYTGTSNPRSAR